MYKKIEIKGFRCFKSLVVGNCKRVNLIAGLNNVGKTAFLEALYIHCGAYHPGLALKTNAFRGFELITYEAGGFLETPFDHIFKNFDTSKPVQIIGVSKGNGEVELKLRVLKSPKDTKNIPDTAGVIEKGFKLVGQPNEILPSSPVLELEYTSKRKSEKYFLILDAAGIKTIPIPPPVPFPAILLHAFFKVTSREAADWFGKIKKFGRYNLVLDSLRVLENRIQEVSLIPIGGEPILHADVGLGRQIPVPLLGGGISRLTSFILAIANAPGGVVLIDEIENGLHHSKMTDVWKVVEKAAREFNTQIFATTHSRECIVAAHEAFKLSSSYDFQLTRLEKVKDDIIPISYDKETLESAINLGFEVR